MKKINSIHIKIIPDELAELSHLGQFSDTPGEFPVPRQVQLGEYQYFNAANVENMKQAQQNYKRAMQFSSGELSVCGIKAVAEISTGSAEYALTNTIESGGLWGIESDSDEMHVDSVAQEEISQLTDILVLS